MLYGVVTQSTANSTLVDPIVSDYNQQQAATQAATVAAQQAQQQAAATKKEITGWAVLLVAGVGAWWFVKRRGMGK